MATHPAVVTVAVHAPLEIIQVPTVAPEAGEVRVRVEWTASTPLDLHQADGGLLVKHPQVLGDGIAGSVVEVGPDVKNLKLGDKVARGQRDLWGIAGRLTDTGLRLWLARAEGEGVPGVLHGPGISSWQGIFCALTVDR